ncbi:MAG: hypothetical protein HGGPFJEG_01699 [Ignavibacteria bacterium]|nr:hypothetical protein [Ignavibacteria bacterium]
MTQLLEKAIKKISRLPEKEQDEIAEMILSEIEDEKLWSERFKSSQQELSKLADEAITEFKINKTKSMDL